MKTLYIGDWHAKPSDLHDSERLREYVYQMVEEHRPDRVVFLGDQYDTHGIVHVTVQHFWRTFFKRLTDMMEDGQDGVLALVGNHDMPGDRSSWAHAMQAHADDITVVDWHMVRDNCAYVSYEPEGVEHFSNMLEEEGHDPTKLTLVCHQTFLGAQYENGFYAKDGIDAGKLPFPVIYSGHIHAPGAIGKVWYPGSPRYLTVSDANIARHIYLVEGDPRSPSRVLPLPTDNVVSKMWHFQDTPQGVNGMCLQVKDIDRVVIDIVGPAAFVEERRKLLARPGVRLRTFPTDRPAARLTESEGIPAAFRKYLGRSTPRFGTPMPRLLAAIDERLHV